MNTPSPEQWISNRRRPDVFPALVELYNGNQVIWWDDISKYEFLRWQPWTNVPPPPKPKTQEELDYEAIYNIGCELGYGLGPHAEWGPCRTAFYRELLAYARKPVRDMRKQLEQYIATHPLDGCDVRALRAIAEGGS